MGFIYKITNTCSKKCYIGETLQSNPEERWKVHQQSISRGAGCPALGDAIRKYGIQQFTFEILIICFDEDRFLYEREYIKKYNTVVPNGYNILDGGEGGGFKGKHHTEKTKEILRQKHKEIYDKNPSKREIHRERTMKQMKLVRDSGIDFGNKIRTSEKFKKALEEGRVGGAGHMDGCLRPETKHKISNSLKIYYSKNPNRTEVNIEEHRNAMAKAVGVRVNQFTKDGLFIKTHASVCEAGREIQIHKNGIQAVLDRPNRSAGGFVWKRENGITHTA